MNDSPIATYAPPTNYPSVPDGLYPAHVIEAYILMACCSPKKCLHTHTMETPLVPETNKWGKSRIAVKFELDNEVGPDNGPITINRYFSISYGATGGTYAALATFIQAATGIKCGDKAQRNIKPSDLIGKSLQVLTANVEKDDKTRTNVTGTLPPNPQAAMPPRPPAPPKAAPAVAAPAPAPKSAKDQLEEDLGDLPF